MVKRNNKDKPPYFLILGIAAWGVAFSRYLQRGCVHLPRSPEVCDTHALIVVVILFFLFVFIPSYFFFRKNRLK